MPNNLFSSTRYTAACCVVWLCLFPTAIFAQDAPQSAVAPQVLDLDLSIKYFNRELSSEGVLHENSYQEKMLRRNGHVWTERVIPTPNSANDTTHPNHEHKDFNYIVLPRHVRLEGNKTIVEFINSHDRQVVYIAPTEYENINFDGSWLNTFYLVNPQIVSAMPVSRRTSAVAHASWHEVKKNGLFQRVLWDEKSSIPLIIETGDQAGSFLQRVTVQPDAKLAQDLPWLHLQGFTQKEYSDFLD